MSSSLSNGPSAVGRGRGFSVYFWFLMAIGSMWVSGNFAMPGQGDRRNEFIDCEKCSEQAVKQADGYYKCGKGHRFRPAQEKEDDKQE